MGMRATLIRLSDEKAASLLESPEDVHEFIVDPDYPEIEIDKAWHILHFLFTGTLWEGEGPKAFLVKGGTPVGEEDLGFGPGRLFGSNDVAEIDRELETLVKDDLRAAFRPELMGSTHGWRQGRDEENLAYAVHYFEILKTFIAASVGAALFIYVA